MGEDKVLCEICKQKIIEGELQVWLQTKTKEFDKWSFVEDLKFHNACWVAKMESIRKRGQNDTMVAVTNGIKQTIKTAQDSGHLPSF